MKRKKLLISWGNVYNFQNNILPNLSDLHKYYDLDVILVNYFASKEVRAKLSSLVEAGVIANLWFAPQSTNIFSFAKFISFDFKKINFNYDFYLTLQECSPLDKCINQKLPKGCIRVCYYTDFSYLRERLWESIEVQEKKKSLISRIKSEPWQIILKKALYKFNAISNKYIFKKFRNLKSYILFRICLDINNVDIRPNKLDSVTSLGSGESSYYLFRNQIDVDLHKSYFPKAEFGIINPAIKYSNSNSEVKNIICSPLSGFVGQNQILPEYLEAFYRDMKIVCDFYDIHEVHLRLHPRETGKWPIQLSNFLNNCGIVTKIVDSNVPIMEAAREYKVVAGFASLALQDVMLLRANIPVIVFEKVSKCRYRFPLENYGSLDSFYWIAENGAHNIGQPLKDTLPTKTLPEFFASFQL